MRREIDGPDADWCTQEEAIAFLRVNAYLFSQLVDAGYIAGVRRLSRQVTLYHWKGLVGALWRLELGDLPPDLDELEKLPKVGKSGGKSGKADESGA